MAKRKHKGRDKAKRVRLNYGDFDPNIPVNDFFENLTDGSPIFPLTY